MRRIAIVSTVLGVLVVVAFVLMAPKDAAWKADPADAVYDNPANWTSGSVPNGTAVFGASAQSDITFTRKRINHYRYPNGFRWDLEGWISAASWRFDQGAGRYHFTIGAASYPIDPTPRVPCTGERLRFTGAGIAIRAGHVSITNDSCLAFVSKSTAGSVSISNNKWLDFRDGADAGSASILNANALRFHDSNARNAVITNNAELAFRGNSSADDAAILNNGRVWIIENSTGGNAAIDNATSDASVIFDRARPSLGSIAGAGKVYLDKAQLSIGGNNQSTTFSGVISDSESHNDTEASLIKVGSGTLTLSGTNSYRGPTSVIGGVLVVDGSIATSRLTRVERGGRVAGTGAIGSTQVAGGILAPGAAERPGVLSVQGNLAFLRGATYVLRVDPTAASAVKVTNYAISQDATLHVVFAPGSYGERKYKILEASGGKFVGRFAPAITSVNLPADLEATLSYEGYEVYLVLSAKG